MKMVDYAVKLEVPLQHDDESSGWIWFHPNVCPMPDFGKHGKTAALLVLQRHLGVPDYYSSLFFMRSDDMGESWSEPVAPPELGWRKEDDATVTVSGVTPGWLPQARKVIAIGSTVAYDSAGNILNDSPYGFRTMYALYEPEANQWSEWKELNFPIADEHNFCCNSCAQWVLEPDGSLLIPFYHGPKRRCARSVTVARFAFNGESLSYLEHGNTLTNSITRGLNEPSLVRFNGTYYLTIRHDHTAFVTVSGDGLHFEPAREWTFDDHSKLGSYNTQQHWLAHSEGLLLVYTRQGANNDHIFRHRAPLFVAQVDTERLCVIRESERILIPENGAPMGNFGCSLINEWESWVTVSEFMWRDWMEEARKRGARGRTFIARLLWRRPNLRAKPH